VVYLAVCIRRAFPHWQRLFRATRVSSRSIKPMARVSLVLLVVVSVGLFSERYVVNMVRYHSPFPVCQKVLSVQECSAYGPWIRDYNFTINKVDADVQKSPVLYTEHWLYGMWLRSFFVVDGPATQNQSRGPLPVPAITGVVVGVTAVVAVIITLRRLLRRYDKSTIFLLGGTTLLYVGSLWFEEYKSYLHTGQPVAINGRYLLPVALFLMLFGALALQELLRKHRRVSLVVAAVIIFGMAWGGGALTYILRSNDAWYWQNRVVLDANHVVQHALWPLTPGVNNPAQFLH
jgi:hypothetical protein